MRRPPSNPRPPPRLDEPWFREPWFRELWFWTVVVVAWFPLRMLDAVVVLVAGMRPRARRGSRRQNPVTDRGQGAVRPPGLGWGP